MLLITTDPETGGIMTSRTSAALRLWSRRHQVARIPNASHNIRRDQFARFVEIVRAFLAS